MRRATPDRTRTFATLGAGAAIIAAALALGGCSPSHPQPSRSQRSPASPGSGPTNSPQASAAAAGHGRIGTSSAQAGAALTVSDSSGTKLDVTLEQVVDPANAASQYSKPASGQHFVGAKLHLRNEATTSYENNANNETTIVPSDGKTGHASYSPIAGCGKPPRPASVQRTARSALTCLSPRLDG